MSFRLPRVGLVAVALVSLALASFAAPAVAQATEAPAFIVGSNKLYCHATTDGLTGWINTLVADGDEAPYYLTGAGTVVPVAGVGVDPVAQEAVDAHLPLMPALGQTIVVGGTVTVQAFIGSGAYGGGVASFGTSLMAGTTVLGSAEPVDHTMQPHNGNVPGGTGPYEELTWTFEVPETPIPAGTPLEWVISGTVDLGNNVFLSCNEARGRSNIDIPILALEIPSAGGSTETSTNTTTTAAATSSSASSTTGAITTTSATTTTSSSTTEESSSTEDTGTVDPASAESKDSPGFSMAAALAVFAVAALAVRRRLQ